MNPKKYKPKIIKPTIPKWERNTYTQCHRHKTKTHTKTQNKKQKQLNSPPPKQNKSKNHKNTLLQKRKTGHTPKSAQTPTQIALC